MVDEEKKQEGGEHLEKKECPLSLADWVMFLSDENIKKDGFRSALVTTIMTIVVGLVGIMAGSIYALMNISNIEHAFMVSPSLRKFWIFILCVILALIIFEFFVLSRIKKKVEPFEKLRDKVLTGKSEDSDEILTEYMNARGK